MKKLLIVLFLLPLLGRAQTLPRVIMGLGEYLSEWGHGTDSSWWASGNDISLLGTNGVGSQGVPHKVSYPAYVRFEQFAGGLHGAFAKSTLNTDTAYGWFIGNTNSESGGATFNVATKLRLDSAGNLFDSLAQIQAGWQAVSSQPFWVARKYNGTVWTWGYTLNSGQGNGGAGHTFIAPVQVTTAAGKKAMQLSCTDACAVLYTDGTVSTWSNSNGYQANLGRTGSGAIPADIGLHHIRYIWMAYGTGYAIDSSNNIFGWGEYGCYMGIGVNNTVDPISTPTNITSTIIGVTGGTVSKIVGNHTNTLMLLTNGQAWVWGGIPTGANGVGLDFNWAAYTGTSGTTPYNGGTPAPYNWNLEPYLPTDIADYVIATPKHVAPGKTFKDIFGGILYCFELGATDSNDVAFVWGRNKGAVQPIHTIPADTLTTNIQASYHVSWDVTYPTQFDPFNVTFTQQVTSPYCILHPTGSPCSNYTIPSRTPPHAVVTSATVNPGSYVLDGRSSTLFYRNYGIWKQKTGPATVGMAINTGTTDSIQLTTLGTYTFLYTITDDVWQTDSAVATITVVAPTTPPTVNAGSNQNIVVSSTTLTGTATGNSGSTISSTTWGQVSGPTTATIGTPSSLTTTVGNLTTGIYVFKLSATDSNGNTASANVQVTVALPVMNFILHKRGHMRIYM